MRTFRHWIIGCLAVLILTGNAFALEAESPASITNLSLTVDLQDGSRVVGTPRLHTLLIQTSFADLTIPLDRVASLSFGQSNQSALVQLRNADKVTGNLNLKALELTTVFGPVSIPLPLIQKISMHSSASGGLPDLTDAVLYFSFDQDDGEKVIDQSSNHLNGHVNGATWTRNGRRGGAMEFNGNSRITVPHDGQLDFGLGDFTVCFWFKVRALDHTQQLYWHAFNPEIQVEPNGKLRGYYSWNLCGTVDSSTTIEAGEWHFVAMSRQDGKGFIYLDGKENATVDASKCNSSSPDPLLLGFDGQMGEPLNGWIDEFIIWKRALSADEVEALYNKDK